MTVLTLLLAVVALMLAGSARSAQQALRDDLTMLKEKVAGLSDDGHTGRSDSLTAAAAGTTRDPVSGVGGEPLAVALLREMAAEQPPVEVDPPPAAEPIPAIVAAVPVLRVAASAVAEAAVGHTSLLDVLLEESPEYPVHGSPQRGFVGAIVDRARDSDELEALIGGRWLNRLGAAALILAAGFFFKYAVDNNVISPSLRVAIGLAVGLLLLVQAWRTHRRDLAIFAQGLTGAGLAVLYISVYASSNFYHLLPEVPSLGAMGAVTALAFYLALFYDSLAVALLASAGGYVSVPLLGLTPTTQLGAIGYILLLDAWALRIVFRRDDWYILEPIGFVATYAIYFGWYATVFTPRNLGLAVVVLALVWGVFFALELAYIVTHRDTRDNLRHLVGTTNIVLAFGGLASLLLEGHRMVLGASILVLAGVYLVSIVLSRRPLREGDWTATRFTLTSTVLATVGTALLTGGLGRTVVWSLGALALVWCGTHWKLDHIWQSGLVVFALAAVNLVVTHDAWITPDTFFLPLANLRALAFALLAGTLAAAATLTRRQNPGPDRIVSSGLDCAWIVTAFAGITAETIEYFAHSSTHATLMASQDPFQGGAYALALIWAMYGLALVWGGLPRRSLPALGFGGVFVWLGIVLGAATAVLSAPTERVSPMPNARFVALALLCTMTSVVIQRLSGDASAYLWIGRVVSTFRLAVLLLGFELVTIEIGRAFAWVPGNAGSADLAGLTQLQAFALAIAWVIYALPLVYGGLRRHITEMCIFGLAIASMGAALGATCVLVFGAHERFTPVLNYRTAALVLLCTLTTTVVRGLTLHRAAYPWIERIIPLFRLAPLFLGFELVTIETINAFARALEGATGGEISNLTQLRAFALAIVWMLYGLPLVFAGLRRHVFQIVSFGLASIALGLAMGAGNTLAYEPIRHFTPVANHRFGAVLLLGALASVLVWRLHRARRSYPWVPTAIDAYRAAILLLGFELLTAEINDYFRHAVGAVAGSTRPSETFVKIVTLAAIWMLYSFPLVRYGVRHGSLSVLLLGLAPMTAATGAGAVAAVALDPGGWYSTALTLRPFIIVVLGAGIMLQMRLAREGTKIFPWLDTVLLAMQATTILLGFELITTQTRDLFDSHAATAGAATLHSMRDLEQLALSTLWLVYGVVLLAIGLWQRVRWIRLGALAAMGFTMGKIVLYDLSFLTPAYRSVSFGALGVVLLAASYLYTRYRSLLTEPVGYRGHPAGLGSPSRRR